MMKKLRNWFRKKSEPVKPRPQSSLLKSGVFEVKPTKTAEPAVPVERKVRKDDVSIETSVGGRVEDAGPGKNVLIRSKYVREDAGTHDTLKILDESLDSANDDEGMDPYNTGRFDRSKNWNNRFRK